MAEWFLDPKSISLMAGAALAVTISVWQGTQTAALVADLVKWRLEVAAPAFARHESQLHTLEGEISRLRDFRGKP